MCIKFEGSINVLKVYSGQVEGFIWLGAFNSCLPIFSVFLLFIFFGNVDWQSKIGYLLLLCGMTSPLWELSNEFLKCTFHEHSIKQRRFTLLSQMARDTDPIAPLVSVTLRIKIKRPCSIYMTEQVNIKSAHLEIISNKY